MKTSMHLLIMLLMSFSIHLKGADKDSRDRFHLGIKAGMNRSNVFDIQGENFKSTPKYGFAGGAFLSVPVIKYLGLQPEVLFSQKGFKAKGNANGTPYDLIRTTSYLDIPLLVAFKPSEYITILGGPQYSYLMNQTDVFLNGLNTSASEQQFKNEDIRKNILSGIIGFDVNLDHLILGGRYAFDLQSNNGNGTTSTPKYKNVWIQGTLGFRF